MGGIGQMEGDRTFLALCVDDAEAGRDVRGGVSRNRALGDIDADGGNRRSAGIQCDGEVFAFGNALGHLDGGASREGDRGRCGRFLGGRLFGDRSCVGVLRRGLGGHLRWCDRGCGLQEESASRGEQSGGMFGQEGGDVFLPSGEVGLVLLLGQRLGIQCGQFSAELGVLLRAISVLRANLGVERMVIAHALKFGFRGVVVVRVDAPLLHVGEERLQGVEVGRLNRVELMVVALGAAEGAAQPGIGDGSDAFGAVLREVFLHLGAAFAGHHIQAIIAARDELFFGRVRQEVAGELLAREDVERLIRVEGVDDVIAVREDALILVAVVADRVGEAGDIEPPDCHAFAETGGG